MTAQMSSQGDDDSPHDAPPPRGGAFTIAAHDGNGWPTSSALGSTVPAEARADTGQGGRALLRPVMRMPPTATLTGGHGHYADRSIAQPDQPEELLQVTRPLMHMPLVTAVDKSRPETGLGSDATSSELIRHCTLKTQHPPTWASGTALRARGAVMSHVWVATAANVYFHDTSLELSASG